MKKLFLLLTLNLFCFGESYHEWVDFGGSPSATVAGCVNVITGDLSINQDDIVVRGHEPIRIKRKFYSQFSFLDEYQGWECGFTHLVATLKKEKENNKTRVLKVPEASGIHLSYKISWEKIKQGVKSGKNVHF
ncbi:MAG: hypothetical protein HRU43_02285, partial [Simkaniaceae bacterium]|nr:hypothetical protein [Simkaniaceae bacterium]